MLFRLNLKGRRWCRARREGCSRYLFVQTCFSAQPSGIMKGKTKAWRESRCTFEGRDGRRVNNAEEERKNAHSKLFKSTGIVFFTFKLLSAGIVLLLPPASGCDTKRVE